MGKIFGMPAQRRTLSPFPQAAPVPEIVDYGK